MMVPQIWVIMMQSVHHSSIRQVCSALHTINNQRYNTLWWYIATTTETPCCDVADQDVSTCREGCACCPDGTWVGSIGDANTFTCNGVELQKSDSTAVFGQECSTTTTEGIFVYILYVISILALILIVMNCVRT